MNDFKMYLIRKDFAMIYEIFLRCVYHCGQNEDPFSLAVADLYAFDDNDNLDPDTFVGIWTAIELLKPQVKKESQQRVHKIKGIIEKNPTNKCFRRICKELFKLIDDNNIDEFPHWKALPYMIL